MARGTRTIPGVLSGHSWTPFCHLRRDSSFGTMSDACEPPAQVRNKLYRVRVQTLYRPNMNTGIPQMDSGNQASSSARTHFRRSRCTNNTTHASSEGRTVQSTATTSHGTPWSGMALTLPISKNSAGYSKIYALPSRRKPRNSEESRTPVPTNCGSEASKTGRRTTKETRGRGS
jgi:hypothetical protein